MVEYSHKTKKDAIGMLLVSLFLLVQNPCGAGTTKLWNTEIPISHPYIDRNAPARKIVNSMSHKLVTDLSHRQIFRLDLKTADEMSRISLFKDCLLMMRDPCSCGDEKSWQPCFGPS